MTQLALILPLRALARAHDPRTSKAAAFKVAAVSISERVLASLREQGPATTRELAARLAIDLVSVSPRMKPLEQAGLVRRKDTDPEQGMTIWEAT